jgi:peptide methionine sulfoxide reductase msrA/msrB
MLRWIDILKFASQGTPEPDRIVEKTDEEWKALLTPEQYRVTRQHGTEPAFSSDSCAIFESGKYECVCCETPLFDADEKFDSGTGWPSFTQPIKVNAVSYIKDNSHGMVRVEALCNTCDAHLGHVFLDGPDPSGLRYCMNAAALKKTDSNIQKITLGGGCFWCTEAIFQNLKGVLSVESGYSGGQVHNPTYREVCSGRTGHAEVIQIAYDPEEISYEDILRVHMGTHNPCTLNQQGADKGTQYRSVIFYRDDHEKAVATDVISELTEACDKPVVTELAPFEVFFAAEEAHQNYYNRNEGKPYCDAVIEPKLAKFRSTFAHLLSKPSV